MKDSFAQLLSLGSKTRRRITIAIDVCCLIFTTYFALSFSRDSLFSLSTMDIVVILTAVIVTLVLLILSKSYRAVIRHLDVRSIVRTALSITFGSMIWIAMLVGSDFEYSNLLLVFLVQCTASLFLLIGYRSTLYLFISKRGKPTKTAAHVAIYGLSAESRQFAAGLSKSKKYKTVFFFSEDPALGGGLVDGIRVYSEDRLDWALKRFTPAIFLFPQSGESPIRQTRLISRLMQSGIEVKLFDSVDDSLDKHLTMEVARPIEIEDLLGRKENPVVQNLLASAVEGRRILVTGAAGSIGSQLCRRISTLGPASLSMLDIDESGLTAMGEEIAKEEKAD